MNLFDENGKFMRQYNQYEFKEDYVVGYTNNGDSFYIDIDDYEKVKEYCWYKDKDGYFRTNVYRDGKRTALLLHDLIMNLDYNTDLLVDHIHGVNSKMDNRKTNLRLTTKFVNNINQGLRKDNTSGVKGVDWDRNKCRWISRISINGQRLFLGAFINFEDAKQAREEAEEKYYGEYSYKNSMDAVT